jgi:hypothetical protein
MLRVRKNERFFAFLQPTKNVLFRERNVIYVPHDWVQNKMVILDLGQT